MERRSRFRAVLGVLLAAGLVMPATVVAAPPDKGTERALSVSCPPLSAGDGTTALLYGSVSSRFGAFGELFVWTGDEMPDTGAPVLGTDFSLPATGTVDGTTMTLVIPLIDTTTGEPAGTAHVEATLEGTGEVETIDDRFDFGNAFERVTGTIEEADVVAGTMTVDSTDLDISFDLSECIGSIATIDYFATQPSTFVGTVEGAHLSCGWETAIGFVGLEAHEFGDGFSFASLYAPTRMVGGQVDGVDLTPSGVSFEIQLYDEITGEPLANPAIVDATFTYLRTETERNVRDNGWEKFVYDIYAVEGTLVAEDLGLELDLESCLAWFESGRFKGTTQATGPKGKPAVNDDPSGALPIAAGTTLRGSTTGTALEPEAEGSCVPFDEFFGLQFGHTVWYELEGTGEEVTLDTAGSHFDTVLVVYEVDEGLQEIACVDDVPTGDLSRTTNASLTFLAEEGVTYLVQLGGYAGEADRFRLTVR